MLEVALDPERAYRPTDDVLTGLRAPRKHLPCRLLYDARGAALFEAICELDEYYLTRAELALLRAHLPAIAARIGPTARIVEPGSGAGIKTRRLLAALDTPASYVPIDVSAAQLAVNARALRAEFPTLEILPITGDYTRDLMLPRGTRAFARTIVFFPGSTIGNFEPRAAHQFLARWAAQVGTHGMLVLGADANTDPGTLVPAYDDARGVTAAFDLNVLAHVNRTHGASFDLDAFEHRAVWNAARSRIEMHLVSRRRQVVVVAGERVAFERGEPIVTEHCYKHSPDVLRAVLRDAGWQVHTEHADPHGHMRLWIAARAA
jgi:dimethylhistidine N-methyltransferase